MKLDRRHPFADTVQAVHVMAYAVATVPNATFFEKLIYTVDEYSKIIVRGIALCLGALVTLAVTTALLTAIAGWLAATAFSIDPHLRAKAPLGTEQLAFLHRPRIEIAAADRAKPSDMITTSTAINDTSIEAVPEIPAASGYMLASAAPMLPVEPVHRANLVRLPDTADDPSVGLKRADISIAPAREEATADDLLVTASISPIALPRKRPRIGELWLHDVHSRTAVYDIAGHTVHMPDGRRLEAHSGRGRLQDNPAYVHRKNRGPTPPNVYELTMRERRFHGVRAIRLNPAPGSTMYGRDGMLAHTYLLGPGGESSGCVVFKKYDAFLKAFLRGEVTRMVVVPRLSRIDVALLRNAHRNAIE